MFVGANFTNYCPNFQTNSNSKIIKISASLVASEERIKEESLKTTITTLIL